MDVLGVTGEGHILITDVSGVGSVPYPEWVVMKPTGRLTGRITATSVIEILDMNGDSVLVRAWNQDDVERVELRRIKWQP